MILPAECYQIVQKIEFSLPHFRSFPVARVGAVGAERRCESAHFCGRLQQPPLVRGNGCLPARSWQTKQCATGCEAVFRVSYEMSNRFVAIRSAGAGDKLHTEGRQGAVRHTVILRCDRSAPPTASRQDGETDMATSRRLPAVSARLEDNRPY